MGDKAVPAMFPFALRRLALLLATALVASLGIFCALEALPGDAAQTMLGETATPEAVAALTHKLGLDQPFIERYAHWIGGASHGDFGQSSAYDSPIGPLLGQAAAVSVPLAILATLIGVAIALPAGAAAAGGRGTRRDAAIVAASQIGLAAPSFWVAILLVLVFAVRLRWAPAGGFPGWDHPREALSALLLPALSLAAFQGAVLTRVIRSALIEAMGEEFFRTARAKGLSKRAALWRHALPNALAPALTILGLQFANLVAGAVVVENVFVLPGLGRLIFQAVSNRDTLVVADATMLLVAMVILVSFAVDLACAVIDPRWRGAS